MKRQLLVWVLSLAAVLSLLACAGAPPPAPTAAPPAVAPATAPPAPATAPTAAPAAKIELTFTTPHGGALTAPKAFMEFFGPEVTKRTNGQVTFKYMVGGALSKGGEEMEAVESGLAQMGGVVWSYYSGKMPLGVFTYWVPFGPTDPAMVISATRKLAEEIPEFAQGVESHNQKILYYAPFADYNLISKFPVKTIDDLKGKTISVVGINAPWFSGIGMVPVTTYVGEDYMALQTGVFETETLMWDMIYLSKLHEPAKYSITTHLGAQLGYAFTINNDTWKKLSPDVQNVMLKVASEAETETVNRLAKAVDDSVAGMKKDGSTFYDLPLSEIQRWASMLDEIPDMRAKEADAKGLPGTKLVKRYIEIVSGMGFKFPRSWVIR